MGGISNIVEASMANAKVDTSKADNAIAAINSYTPDNSNLDSIGSGYNALKFDNDINASDMTVSTEEGLANMGKAGLTGAMEGFKVGGLWGGIAGLAGGLASSGFSWLEATLDAEDEAEIKRKEEALAEIGAQNKGISPVAISYREHLKSLQENYTGKAVSTKFEINENLTINL